MKRSCVTRYEIKLNKKDIPSGRVRAAYLVDLHNCIWEPSNDRIIRFLRKYNPDLVLCGGDMINANPGRTSEIPLDLMRKIASEFPVYYANGNHEFRARLYPEDYGTMYDDYIIPLKECGVHLLIDEYERVTIRGIPVNIYGYELPAKNYKRFTVKRPYLEPLKDTLGTVDKKEISVLLAHNPKYLKEYFDFGADLILSGHYHGGLVGVGKHTGLVSPGLMPLPHIARGDFKRGGSTAIVSAGMGEHTLPIRVNIPREMLMIDIIV